MSVLTIQVGQCGNQLGQTFFQTMLEEVKESSELVRQRVIESYFKRAGSNREDLLQANAVLVDMEPKVVQKCLQTSKQTKSGIVWEYQPGDALFKQGGSGNNWALGYHYYDEDVYQVTSESIRRQVEQMDYFGGFQVLQSLAGGTGSGLGTHLVERLREDYPRANLLNVAVWPYMTGEVVLQNYNVLLTLNGLINHSNGVTTVFNDEILTTCRELLKSPQPSYALMNKVIAQQMTSILYPVADTQKSRVGLWQGGSANILHQIVDQVCSQPQFKLLQMKQIPFQTSTASQFNADLWPGVASRIRQMVATNSGEHKVNWNTNVADVGHRHRLIKSVSNMVFLRGDGVYDDKGVIDAIFEDGTTMAQQSQNSQPRIYRDSHRLFGHEKVAAMLSNNQSQMAYLNSALGKANDMLHQRAYLHHFERYGVSQDDFHEAFLTCEEALANYQQLS